MKLCNAICKKCGHGVFNYQLSYWNFYTKKWEQLDTKILCPKCDKVMRLPIDEPD